MSKRTDRRFLTEVAYANDDGLRDRSALYDYQDPRIDLVAEAMVTLGDVRGQRVVDVGCGNGRYESALVGAGASSVVALDLSAGMLRAIASSVPYRVVGDASGLPLSTRSADVVLLLHMLYHVPDPGRAVAEARRVLRPGGRVLVATAGDGHLSEMNAIWLDVLRELQVPGRPDDLDLVNRRFPPDAARTILAAEFSGVVERTLATPVVLSDPGPVVRHAASTSAAQTASPRTAEVLDRMRDRVASVIARDGAFRTMSETVMLLAR